jgi:hypothetical protein
MAFQLRFCLAALSALAAACTAPAANQTESNGDTAVALPAGNAAVAAAGNEGAAAAGGPCPVEMRGFSVGLERSQASADEWDVTARWEMGPDAQRRYAEPTMIDQPPLYIVDYRPGTMDTPADAEAGWMPSVSVFTYSPAYTHIVVRCMGAEVRRLPIPRP